MVVCIRLCVGEDDTYIKILELLGTYGMNVPVLRQIIVFHIETSNK